MDKPENKMPAPEKKRRQWFFKKRSFKYGSMSTAFVIIFIAAVVLVNVILSAVVSKYPLQIDLTNDRDIQLTSDSINYVKGLKQDITIYVMASEDSAKQDSTFKHAYRVIQQYPRYNSHISVQYVDPDKNPTFQTKFGGETLSNFDIVVQSGKKYKHMAGQDMFDTSTDSSTGSQTVTGNKTEQQVDTGIQYVTTAVTPQIVVSTGNGETGYDGIETLLKNNNYTITEQDLNKNAIPSSASAIAIVDPQADFSKDELTKIDAFLTNNDSFGKSIMVFFDPSEAAMANLQDYVKEWGVQVGSGVVYDTSGYSTFVPAGANFDSTVFANMNQKLGVPIVQTRPLTLLFSTKDIRTTQSLIQTPETSALWNPKDIKTATFSASASDTKGPFTAMALATKYRYDGTTKLVSNMLVSGSSKTFDSSILTYASYNNSQVMLDSVNYISGLKSTFNVVSKDMQAATLSVTTPVKSIFTILFLGAIPLAALVIGVVVWLRRRHL